MAAEAGLKNESFGADQTKEGCLGGDSLVVAGASVTWAIDDSVSTQLGNSRVNDIITTSQASDRRSATRLDCLNHHACWEFTWKRLIVDLASSH